MANDFSSETHLVTHYTFTGDDPFGDKSGKGNHLYRHGGPAVYTADKKEGDTCGQFVAADGNRLYLNDAHLSADFPAKNGTSNPAFTVCGWYKPSLLTSWRTIAAKVGTGRCWAVGSYQTSNRLWVCWAYGSWYDYYVDDAFTLNDWSFVTVRFDDSTNTCNARVYNQGSGNTVTGSWSPANAMRCAAEPFVIGATGTGQYADGLIDNLCIFSRLLSDDEALAVQNGTFDFESETNLVARYRMEKKGLGHDESSNANHMRNTGIPDQAGPRDDVKAALFHGDHFAANWCKDADLSADFPGKSGTTNKLLTVCYWFNPESLSADYEHAVCKMGQVQNRSWFTRHPSGDYTWEGGCNTGLLGAHAVDSGRAVSAGTWYHVGVILDDANDRAYIRLYDSSNDTVYAVERTNFTVTWPMTTAPFTIGSNMNDASTGPGNDEYDGFVGEVVILNRALSPAQIDKIRQGTFGAVPAKKKNSWLGMHF